MTIFSGTLVGIYLKNIIICVVLNVNISYKAAETIASIKIRYSYPTTSILVIQKDLNITNIFLNKNTTWLHIQEINATLLESI